jgi:hypothetical protein
MDVRFDLYNQVCRRHATILWTSDFAFRFVAVYVQRRLIFSCRFLFIVNTCFGLIGHRQVYRLWRWRNLLLTVMLFCFSYALASDSRFCGLANSFVLVSLNNCYARVCLMVLLVCWFVACGCPECFLGRKFVEWQPAITVVLQFNIVTCTPIARQRVGK